MASPLVSVLVPIYNAGPYIERCARSLFEQSYNNLEFVFCNDFTPDGSLQILEEVISDYPQHTGKVRIICHERNRGLSAARNTLVKNSKGDFIFHVDSDDWVEKNAIELLLAKQRETDADIVTGRAYAHYDNDKMVEYYDGGWDLDRNALIENILMGKCGASVWRRLIRRDLYTDHNIKCLEGVDSREDFQVIIPLIYFSREVAGINNFIYHYNRKNQHSITYNLKKSLTYQMQSLISSQVVLNFITGKNEYYMRICNENMVERAHNYLIYQYQIRNKKGYKVMVNIILSSGRQYWRKIKWNNPIIRGMERNYSIMCLTYPVRKVRYNFFIRKSTNV